MEFAWSLRFIDTSGQIYTWCCFFIVLNWNCILVDCNASCMPVAVLYLFNATSWTWLLTMLVWFGQQLHLHPVLLKLKCTPCSLTISLSCCFFFLLTQYVQLFVAFGSLIIKNVPMGHLVTWSGTWCESHKSAVHTNMKLNSFTRSTQFSLCSEFNWYSLQDH
jgi:hypothetical protein